MRLLISCLCLLPLVALGTSQTRLGETSSQFNYTPDEAHTNTGPITIELGTMDATQQNLHVTTAPPAIVYTEHAIPAVSTIVSSMSLPHEFVTNFQQTTTNRPDIGSLPQDHQMMVLLIAIHFAHSTNTPSTGLLTSNAPGMNVMRTSYSNDGTLTLFIGNQNALSLTITSRRTGEQWSTERSITVEHKIGRRSMWEKKFKASASSGRSSVSCKPKDRDVTFMDPDNDDHRFSRWCCLISCWFRPGSRGSEREQLTTRRHTYYKYKSVQHNTVPMFTLQIMNEFVANEIGRNNLWNLDSIFNTGLTY